MAEPAKKKRKAIEKVATGSFERRTATAKGKLNRQQAQQGD